VHDFEAKSIGKTSGILRRREKRMLRALRTGIPAVAVFFLSCFGSNAQDCAVGARVEASATIQKMSVIRSQSLGVFDVQKLDCGVGRIVAKIHQGIMGCKVGLTINFSGIIRRGKFHGDSLDGDAVVLYIDAEKSLCLYTENSTYD